MPCVWGVSFDLRALATPPTAAADDDLDDFLNSLTDEAGPPAAAGRGEGGADANVNAEDLDKMLG